MDEFTFKLTYINELLKDESLLEELKKSRLRKKLDNYLSSELDAESEQKILEEILLELEIDEKNRNRRSKSRQNFSITNKNRKYYELQFDNDLHQKLYTASPEERSRIIEAELKKKNDSNTNSKK